MSKSATFLFTCFAASQILYIVVPHTEQQLCLLLDSRESLTATHPPAGAPHQQDESRTEAAEAAADTSRPFTTDYLEDGRMPDAFEPEEFRGMLFHDGVDSQGRPVIVVNTDAVGTTRQARSQALQYMLHRLEPIVTQVCRPECHCTALPLENGYSIATQVCLRASTSVGG